MFFFVAHIFSHVLRFFWGSMWTFNSEIRPERKLKCEDSYGVYGSHKNVLYLYLLGFVLMAIFYGLDHGKWPFLTNIWENISGTFSRHRTSKSKMVATTKTVQKHAWETQRLLPLHGSCVCAFSRVPNPCQEVGNCSAYDFQQGSEDHVLKHQQKYLQHTIIFHHEGAPKNC